MIFKKKTGFGMELDHVPEFRNHEETEMGGIEHILKTMESPLLSS